ncbi:MAG: hypothetical protein MHM6MM_002844 [Cercozoa sp. M6MM]
MDDLPPPPLYRASTMHFPLRVHLSDFDRKLEVEVGFMDSISRLKLQIARALFRECDMKVSTDDLLLSFTDKRIPETQFVAETTLQNIGLSPNDEVHLSVARYYVDGKEECKTEQ